NILCMSIGFYKYSQATNDKLDDVISKGFSMFVSAGNDNFNCCASKESENFRGHSGYRKAIAVGAIENDVYGNGYYRSDYSNFRGCVDIFAPGTVSCADTSKGKINVSGKSFSTLIVAGIAATIMSENPGIKFNKEKLVKMVIDSSMKNVIHNLGSSDTPNRLVNNEEVSIYRNENKKSCGKGVGSCSEGCCTKNGVCLTYNYYPWEECLVENGCQSEFGSCTSKNQAIKDCEKEYNDNKNCYVEISSDMNDAEFIDHCKILESNQCKVYFRKKINNLSICTI
ncbi:peptidase S8/S53 domain-containing protein, partial [Neocallimastix sp. 'constans']